MINEILNLGMLGGVVFGVSWLLQAIESRKQGKSVVTLNFWLLRLLGIIFVLIYSIQVRDVVFVTLYTGVSVIIIYNIILEVKKDDRN